MPIRSDLLATHAEYDADTWGDYEAIYKGGNALKARIRRFLPQNPQEPNDVYAHRMAVAHYRCYVGGIVDYFAAYLFTAALNIAAKDKESGERVDPDDFYARFKDDCDARDNDLLLFLRRRLTEALIKKRSWWLVEMPATEMAEDEKPRDRAEWERLKLGDGHLCAVDAEQVLDWDADEHGSLNWARIYSRDERRTSPISKAVMVTERWEIFDRADVTVYELSYPKDRPPSGEIEVPRIGEPRSHGFPDRVPLLCIDLDDGLWMLNRLASPQIEHLALSNALTWAIRRTCYAMPVFQLEDREKPPVMGAGYYIMIGKDEKFSWAAPPEGPFAAIREEVKAQKDELYRVMQAMSLGVDNNAAAVGRSAESKVADADVVRVILGALGAVVREAAERCYAMLTLARGESYDWAVEGLDSFEDLDVGPLIDAVNKAVLLDIPSQTFRKEVKTRAALSLLPAVDEDTKQTIRQEIEEGVEHEDEMKDLVNEAMRSAVDGGEDPLTAAPDPTEMTAAPKPGANAKPKPKRRGGAQPRA